MFKSEGIGAKFFLNGFPKAGLHLLEGLMQPLAQEQETRWPISGDETGDTWVSASWIPVFKDNAWSLEREHPELTLYALGRTREGCYVKGHMDCKAMYEKFMYWLGIVHIFIYRDPRDVAVSIAHELWYEKGQPGLSTKLGMSHPAKEEYRAMASFEDVLSAVIDGYGKYPGVMTRWEYYSLWLGNSWTLLLRYEEIIREPLQAADAIVKHVTGRMNRILGLEIKVNPTKYMSLLNTMVASAGDTGKSLTFRRGRVGDWRHHFTDRHVEEFKLSDRHNSLVQLGYEQDGDWTI